MSVRVVHFVSVSMISQLEFRPGADPGFQVRGEGGTLKKIAPSGGRREKFGGISCDKSRFYAKKSYFFPIMEGGANIFGVFRVKNPDFTPRNHIFSNFRPPPPWIRPADSVVSIVFKKRYITSIQQVE